MNGAVLQDAGASAFQAATPEAYPQGRPAWPRSFSVVRCFWYKVSKRDFSCESLASPGRSMRMRDCMPTRCSPRLEGPCQITGFLSAASRLRPAIRFSRPPTRRLSFLVGQRDLGSGRGPVFLNRMPRFFRWIDCRLGVIRGSSTALKGRAPTDAQSGSLVADSPLPKCATPKRDSHERRY